MKYGDALPQRSVPEWLPYNLDYTEIKQLIKHYTVAKPLVDDPLQKTDFEDEIFKVFMDQLESINLFVKSKSGEIDRRLGDCRRNITILQQRPPANRLSAKAIHRYAKLEIEIERAGYDIRSLSRFLAAQKTGFHKLLKKYKKWTGSEHLTNRFSGKLENRSSFYQPDFERASSEHSELQGTVQAALASVSQTLDDVPGPPSPDSLSPQYRSRTHSRRHSRRSTLHGDSSAHSSTESTLAGLTDGATYNETSHSSAPASDAGSTQPRRKKIMQQYKRNTRIETINGERYWNELAGDDEDNREAPYTILVAPSHHGSGSEDEDRTLSSYVSHGITKTLRRMRHPLKRKVPIKISESTPLLDDGLETSAETSSDEDMPRKLKSVNGQHYRKTYDLEQNFQNEHKYGYRHLYFMLASLALVILTGSLALHESLKRRRNPEKHAGRRLATDMGAVTGSMVSLMSGIVGITMFLMGGGRAGWIHITTVWLMFGLVCVGAGAVMALVGRTESGG